MKVNKNKLLIQKVFMEHLGELVYSEKTKNKHKKKMDRELKYFKDFPIDKFMDIPPPENESTETKEEIEYLESIPVNKKFVNTADEFEGYFGEFLKEKGLDYPKDELDDLIKETQTIILKLKYHYNRPRPYQIANEKNMDLNAENLSSAKTPSYPSGHATQGAFVSRYLADLYPKFEKELLNMGEDIAFSRNMAKVHYPSDTELGKLLGNDLYDHLEK